MKNQKTKKLNKAGYTLVELIVVIAIMAVFTAMSVIAMSVVTRRNIDKYARIINEMVADFYKNATTKEGDWRLEIKKEGESYIFTQYYKVGDKEEQYNTNSIDGQTVYSVKQVEVKKCTVKVYKDGSEIDALHVNIKALRERAVFDPDSDVDTIVFTNGSIEARVNVVLGTANNYTGTKK